MVVVVVIVVVDVDDDFFRMPRTTLSVRVTRQIHVLDIIISKIDCAGAI